MWDMPVNTDRTITANRPDIIVKDSVNSTCKLIDMTVPSDRNIAMKETEKKKQVQRPRTRNTENVAYENRSDPCGCWCTWYSEEGFQGGKTFCASFCASLIAGSRREFSVCWLCLFVAGVLSEMHEVRTFAPCKAFLFDMFSFFRRLKITLDSEQPMLKEKRIIPSIWGGIKGFEHFLRGEYFSDCASD